MAIKFEMSRLTSRVVRSSVGQRIIKGLESSGSTSNGGGIGGTIGSFLNGLGSLASWLWEPAGKFFSKFSWQSVWSWVCNTSQFIWNFNFNATDATLETQIKAGWQALATQLGGTLGNAFGWLACGLLPGVIILSVNEPLGAFVLEQATAEFVEEFLSNMSALMAQTLKLGTQIFLIETYRTVRKVIKSQSKLIKKMLGDKAEKAIDSWGKQSSEPWSLAIAFDNTLDFFFGKDGWARDSAEEFFEEAAEACVEAGYVVAHSVDTFLAAEMLARKVSPPLGGMRYVEVTPNRNAPDEVIVLGGQEELLKPIIIQSLATHEQFNGRDLGTIYGTAAADMPERRHRPEVVLKFYRKQNLDKNKGDTVDALSMQIAFRLMNKSKEDFATDGYLETLAGIIHQKFAAPPFKITKGKATFTYCDFEKGYQFKLDVSSQQEARRIIEQVLDIQNHRVNDDLLRAGSARINKVSTIPDKITIRGKRVTLPVHNKEGIVSFSYAYLNVGINVPPINLVDLTKRRKDVVHATAK